MPVPISNLEYLGLDSPAIPYRSIASPTDEKPHFISGSVNALPTISNWIEKRPGFSTALESALSAVPGTIKRIFFWKRWAGSLTNDDCFFCMISTVEGSQSKVWKLNLGNQSSIATVAPDASLSLIFTDATSTTPFDYQDSNNFVFFGNANTRQQMLKYDGTDVSLWGVDAPISAPTFEFVTGELPAGMSFDIVTGVLSGTPTTAEDSSITFTVNDAAGATAMQTLTLDIDPVGLEWTTPAGMLPPATVGVPYSYVLAVQSGTTPYAFHILSGTLPAGLTLSSTGNIFGTPSAATSAPAPIAVRASDNTLPVTQDITRSFSVFVSSAAITISPGGFPNATVGTPYTQAIVASGGTSPYVYGVVGGMIPAGLTFTPSTGTLAGTPTAAGSFPITLRVTDAAGLKAEFVLPFSIAAVNLTITTASLPGAQVGVAYSQTIQASGGTSPYAFSFTAGQLTAQTGYVWGYTYTSKYLHESAMSPLSTNSGIFTDQAVGVDLIASNDPQVTGINLYRSTDGGAQDPSIMRLVVSLPNTTQEYEDSTQDIFLGVQTGPALYVNDPPQPLCGFRWSNGRIWGKKLSFTWFTGNEEITNGVPVECMSDAKNGNYYQWPSEVGSIEVTGNGVDIALSEEWWQVAGNTLATFSDARITRGAGVLSPTCSCTVGDVVYWVDTSKQIWSSSGGEIGKDIRPDLANIVPDQTYMVFFKFTTMTWLCILDAANGRLLIYDMDLGFWLVPWTISATALAAGQIAKSIVSLCAAFPTGHMRKLTPTTFTDDGALYGDQLRSGLFSIVPGSRTTARNSTEVRELQQWEMELNTSMQVDGDGNQTGFGPNVPDVFQMLSDDNPITLPLAGWLTLGPPNFLQFDAQWEQHLLLASRRWEAQLSLASRRVAMCAQWNPSAVGWVLYGFDLAWKRT